MTQQLSDLAKTTGRKELHWIAGKKQELDIYRIPLQHLYFNIENGRYADRMFRLRHDNPGVDIDPKKDKWANEIEKMLAGEHRDTSQDKSAFEKLIQDIEQREQLRPGVVKFDGGVMDGNRRFAALRRLNRQNAKSGRFSYFEGVILPKETTDEDLWKIEAGLQLGIDERWDYSPINELLKVREGLRLFGRMISQGKYAGKTPIQLVANSIYGRTEAEIEERAERLKLIDDYLAFIGKKGEYDIVGRTSERFLEGNRIVRAARNQQFDAKKVARLQAVLFYVIHLEKMDNWDLRKIYEAMGGDPKRKGRKPSQKNLKALDDFIGAFPDPREIQARISGKVADGSSHTAKSTSTSSTQKPAHHSTSGKASDGRKEGGKKASAAESQQDGDVDSKADVVIERFKGTMEATKGTKSPRQLVEAALAPLRALEDDLTKKSTKHQLEEDEHERYAVITSLEEIGELQGQCLAALGGKRSRSATRAQEE
jgi:hypothetical protein